MIVYKITNKINGKVYVGQTRTSARVRFLQHCKPRSKCLALAAAIQKYGQDNFTIETLFETQCPKQLGDKEREYIKNLACQAPNGYNLTIGGEGAPQTQEAKAKLSAARIGAKNPMFGKSPTAEHRAKIAAALKGRKRPQEVKDKISANHNPISDKNLTFRRKSA